jgi:hypothetical protein
VRLLLETLDDPYPTPRGALEPDSGPAPSRYVPCDTCRSSGEVRVRGGWKLCLVCDGQGWKRREDEPPWDAYLDLPLAEAIVLPRAHVPPRVGPDDGLLPFERLRARYDRHGAYRELRRHLDWLSLVHPRRYWLVRRVLIEHESRRLDVAMRTELELGVLMLTRRMRSVKVPHWLIERENGNRNRTIEGMAADGYTPGQIAKELGMTREVVKRKLRKKNQRKTRAASAV